MDVAASGGGSDLRVTRSDENVWWAELGGAGALDAVDLRSSTANPSDVLARTDARLRADGAGPVDLTLAKVELDACGAWVTLANAEPSRPIVLRRAGWADVRGHPSGPLGGAARYEPADDRVGLGPGDALVLHRSSALRAGALSGGEAQLDGLLAFAGEPAAAIRAGLAQEERSGAAGSPPEPGPVKGAAGGGAADRPGDPLVVIAVPEDLGEDPKQRVADALGVPLDALELPGYPLGDLQPELWREPPRPPRVARMQLTADPSGVRAVRQLLDRLLASWRLDGRVDDGGLRLAASELATNALRHALPIATTIRYLGDRVRIEVDDASPVLPAFREPDGSGGRGLPLVESVTSAWGTDPRPDGKRVWCEAAVRP